MRAGRLDSPTYYMTVNYVAVRQTNYYTTVKLLILIYSRGQKHQIAHCGCEPNANAMGRNAFAIIIVHK